MRIAALAPPATTAKPLRGDDGKQIMTLYRGVSDEGGAPLFGCSPGEGTSGDGCRTFGSGLSRNTGSATVAAGGATMGSNSGSTGTSG